MLYVLKYGEPKTMDAPFKIIIISTFPPRKCGIASFANDLVNALQPELVKDAEVLVYALDKMQHARLYDWPVAMVIDSGSLKDCMDAAERINRDSSVKLLCFEHEFGLYGGNMGDFLLGFLAMIEKPFVIRFHTVLPSPDAKRLKIVRDIALLAEKVIVMTQHSSMLLKDDYQIAPGKIMIIPHGTHLIDTASPAELKVKYHLSSNLVLTTFGLLSPNKGIETGIQAMKEIVRHFPDALYLVLGRTHPNLLAREGEAYRHSLQHRIKEAGLTDNVQLIDEYLPTAELMEYLMLTDIYLFTSKDPDQAVSGTFLYAMSAGCAIISNSFVLAKEMLDKETGVIIESGNVAEMTKNAIYLLQHDAVRKEMGNQAFLKTRNTVWRTVARKHVRLFSNILKEDISSFKQTSDNAAY